MSERITVSRHWLRVPAEEWLEVKHGVKCEFRTHVPNMSLGRVQKPTPVLAFKAGAKGFDSRLMMLEEAWAEPLGAISEESLQNEGCDTLREFKVRYAASKQRRFNPLQKVYVNRVRLIEETELRECADRLFNRLYPEELRGI